MPEFVPVAKVDGLPPGYIKALELNGVKIALANSDGTFYAVQDVCTHEAELLSGGELEGGSIICPWHSSIFDLKTGGVQMGPATDPLQTFEVKVEGNDVKVAKPGT